MKQNSITIKNAFNKASDIIMSAISSEEGDKVIVEVCKLKNFTEKQIKEVGSEVTQVMLGLTRPEDFVGSLVARTGTTEEVAKAIAQEINEKIFRPIRDELKKVHGIPTVETLRTTNTIPTPRPPVISAPAKPSVLPITQIHRRDSSEQSLDSSAKLKPTLVDSPGANDKEGEIRPTTPIPKTPQTQTNIHPAPRPQPSQLPPSTSLPSNTFTPKPPIVPFGPKTEGLPNLMKKPPAIVIPTKPVATQNNREVKPMTDWKKAQPPEPPNPYRTMREDATKAFMDKSRPAPFIKNVDEPNLNREDLLNSMENPEHSEVKNYVPPTATKNPANSDDLSVLRSKLSGMTNVSKTEVKFVPIPTQNKNGSDPYREALG